MRRAFFFAGSEVCMPVSVACFLFTTVFFLGDFLAPAFFAPGVGPACCLPGRPTLEGAANLRLRFDREDFRWALDPLVLMVISMSASAIGLFDVELDVLNSPMMQLLLCS